MTRGNGTAGVEVLVSPDDVKAVHRRFVTGVTIVTTTDGTTPRGLAVNAFSSISLEPPLVLVCIAATAATYPALFTNDQLAINILAHDQEGVAQAFAVSGGDKFAQLRWHAARNGAPLIDNVAAYFEGEVSQRIPTHTHTMFIVRVTAAVDLGRDPLLYLGGSFRPL
jgi:flavin reductase (DIM6/NTAB) family NADH-FMN oxidoreductase RutF